MSLFECVDCGMSFLKKSQKDQHTQQVHQMATIVKFFNGRVLEILRDVTKRTFTCPTCQVSFKWPKSIQRHATRDCSSPPNLRKTSVKLTIGDTCTPSILRNFGITLNTDINALICNACSFCIGPTSTQIRSHITRVHTLGKKKNEDLLHLEELVSSLNLASEEMLSAHPKNNGSAVRVVQGLPIFDGEMCVACHYLCCSKKTMQRHIKLHDVSESQPVKLQTLFKGTKRSFFRVTVPENLSGVEVDTAGFDDEIDKFTTLLETLDGNEVDDNLVSLLLRQFRWHKKLQRYTKSTCSELMNMCQLSKHSDVDRNMHAAVSAFFVNAMDLLDKTTYIILRCLMKGTSDYASTQTRGLGYVQDETETYRHHMTKLMHMVASCCVINDLQGVWNFQVNSAVTIAVTDLRNECKKTEFDCDSDRVRDTVLGVLEALFVTESEAAVSSRDDFEQFTVYRYVVCSSITGGSLKQPKMLEPSSITSTCAAFIYWARLFVLTKISQKPFQDIDGDLYYVRDGVPTSFNALMEIKRLGTQLSGPSEGRNPVVHWTNNEMTSLVCKTANVSIESLQKLASSLTSHISNWLQHNLLRGFNIDKVRSEIESTNFIDDINARNKNNWFMTRSDNQLAINPQHLLTFLASTSCRNGLWTNNSWNVKRVRQWLLDCDEFMDDMTILMHFTFGQPARASELITFRLRDSNLSFRSVFSIRNRFSTIQVYHKSVNVTGKFKPIARFAPIALNTEMILYFYLVRPVQAFLFGVMYPDHRDSASKYLDYVFVKRGKTMNADQVRRSIAKGFSKFSDMKLDVSTYRHVAVALVDPHFRDQQLSDDLLDEQAGHSRQTASTAYARASNDPSSLSRDQLHKFWLGSNKWHQFLGLTPGKSPLQSDVTRHNQDHEKNVIFPDFEKLSTAISNLEDCYRSLSKTTERKIPSNSQFSRTSQIPPISLNELALAQQVVEKFMKKKEASFRSIEQGIALGMLLSEPKRHRLLILPTGGGKSLLYMARFILDPKSIRTSIVVIPTVALLNESVVKTRLHDIKASRYSNELRLSGEHTNLVFAAVEHVGQEEFRSYLNLLKGKDVLDTIFIDEAHLIIASSSYRPQMTYLPMLTTFGVPLVLLSATVPIKMEMDLSTLFQLQFQTIRSNTNRDNISYCVNEVAKLDDEAVKTMQNYQTRYYGTRNRCIAYRGTRAEVERLCQLFKTTTDLLVSGFHAGMDSMQQSLSVAQWKSGRCIWMIATNAFGVGIDYPSVRIVLHVGGPWSLLEYAQESGRAGRDGFSSQALTLTNRKYQQHIFRAVNQFSQDDFTDVTAFLNDKTQCRRQQLQTLLDGKALPCLADKRYERCDVCDRFDFQGNTNKVTLGETVIEDSANVSIRNNAQDRLMQGEIIEFLDELPPSSCPICWVADISPNKDNRFCKCSERLCFKCLLPGHISSKCPNKISFFPGTCYLCGIPWIDSAGIGPMHKQDDFDNCSSPGKGFIIGAAWASFHNHPSEGMPESPKQYAEWLPRKADSSAFSNLVVTFYKLIKVHGPIISID